jgi:hypothetical protein
VVELLGQHPLALAARELEVAAGRRAEAGGPSWCARASARCCCADEIAIFPDLPSAAERAINGDQAKREIARGNGQAAFRLKDILFGN